MGLEPNKKYLFRVRAGESFLLVSTVVEEDQSFLNIIFVDYFNRKSVWH